MGRLDRWNRSLDRLAGWKRDDVTGASAGMFFLSPAAGGDAFTALPNRARQAGSAEAEEWMLRKDGNAFWGSTVATVLPDREGRPNGFVFVTRETERKRMEDRLVTLAATDPLTGAHDRRAGAAEPADASTQWNRTARGFAVARVDIDHVKAINDQWGHDVGETVSARLASVFRDTLRDKDWVMRWGGEEFLLLLPQTNVEGAGRIAERVRGAVESAFIMHEAERISVTASIGIAAAVEGDGCVDDVIRRADQALYAAKRGGRNRFIAG